MKNKLDKNINKAIPHPNCPTLAWLIAKRVTDPDIDLDCTIAILGPKGSGKSTFAVSLAYEISKCLAIIHNRSKVLSTIKKDRSVLIDELSQHYFNIDHIKSVDPDGTFSLFAGPIMKIDNSVLIADDISISISSRNSMSQQNKAITQVMTINRIFRSVLIMNTIYSSTIDKNARDLIDITVEMLYIDKKKKRSVAKVKMHTVNQATGQAYDKFFTWHGKRIKYWFCNKPPKYLDDRYKKIRREKTIEHMDNLVEDHDERGERGHKRENKFNEALNTFKTKIEGMLDEGKSLRAMSRIDPNLSYDMASKIVSYIKKERGVN